AVEQPALARLPAEVGEAERGRHGRGLAGLQRLDPGGVARLLGRRYPRLPGFLPPPADRRFRARQQGHFGPVSRVEGGQETVVVARGDRVVLVVVTAAAAEGRTQER